MVLLLGADQGEPVHQLAMAEEAIGHRIGTVRARSRDHWTEPWGFTSDRLFLNRALLLSTAVPGAEVMRRCLAIEQELGRVRVPGGAVTSRPIDIDILLIGNTVSSSPDLILPHPRLHLRRFALAPLCDVLPTWQHPLLHRTALQLLDAVPAT